MEVGNTALTALRQCAGTTGKEEEITAINKAEDRLEFVDTSTPVQLALPKS